MYHLGLIGYPIQHSLSPWIHEHLLKRANLSGRYDLFEFDPSLDFEEELSKIKQLNLDGFNVTVPYKEKIIPYLDEVDSEAMAIGAVNTVVQRGGRWIGYNTDGQGYIRSLLNQYPTALPERVKSILILGAGGAARGIFYALTERGYRQIDIANRTLQKANDIAKLSTQSTKTNVFTLDEVEDQLDQYDLIIQTTSVGMSPAHDEQIIKLNDLDETAIVSDIVYQPIKTTIIQAAKNKSLNVHYGHTMLLYQAVDAFEIWTDHQIDVSDLDNKLKQKLEG